MSFNVLFSGNVTCFPGEVVTLDGSSAPAGLVLLGGRVWGLTRKIK